MLEFCNYEIMVDSKPEWIFCVFITALLWCTYVFVDAVLVDGPHGGHMGGEQLLERHSLVARPGADEPRLADGRVADHDALDELLVGLLIIHLTSTWPEAPHRPSFRSPKVHSATENAPKTSR